MEKSAGQAKKVLAEMGPGEYFGEMAALIHAPRTASARSLEESHIAVINGDTLRSLLRESDEVSLFMLKEFSNRITTYERGPGGADPVLGQAHGDHSISSGRGRSRRTGTRRRSWQKSRARRRRRSTRSWRNSAGGVC